MERVENASLGAHNDTLYLGVEMRIDGTPDVDIATIDRVRVTEIFDRASAKRSTQYGSIRSLMRRPGDV